MAERYIYVLVPESKVGVEIYPKDKIWWYIYAAEGFKSDIYLLSGDNDYGMYVAVDYLKLQYALEKVIEQGQNSYLPNEPTAYWLDKKELYQHIKHDKIAKYYRLSKFIKDILSDNESLAVLMDIETEIENTLLDIDIWFVLDVYVYRPNLLFLRELEKISDDRLLIAQIYEVGH